jgi:cell division septation protein DedD
MNSLLDDDDEPSDKDHELTLSTGSILGIFLGLVLLCGLFFGFGYKMGSRKPAPPIAVAAPETPSAPAANFNSFKPAAGSPAGSTAPAPTPSPVVQPARDAEPSTSNPPAPVVRATPPPATPATAATPGSNGIFVVQVAAVSRQEDAEMLVHALVVKGYPAFQRNEAQDKLLHIQVGPFTNRKDADSARQRLLSDGYQPIIK